jgi:hypothetical protein
MIRLVQSDLFCKARRFAEASGCPWFILSAEHGLVAPGQVIAPYERTLNTMRATRRAALRVPSRRWRRSDGNRAPSPPRSRARVSPAQATVVVAGLRHGADADRGGSCHVAHRRPECAALGSIASAGAPLPGGGGSFRHASPLISPHRSGSRRRSISGGARRRGCKGSPRW